MELWAWIDAPDDDEYVVEETNFEYLLILVLTIVGLSVNGSL